MELNELEQFLSQNKETPEVAGLLSKFAPQQQTDWSEFVKTSEGQKVLQSETDRAIQKGIETFKSNFLSNEVPKLVEAELQKKNPPETPQDAMDKMKEEFKRELGLRDTKTQVVAFAKDNDIDLELAELFVDYDTDKTMAGLEKLLAWKEKLVESVKKERVRENAREPYQESSSDRLTLEQQLAEALKQKDIAKSIAIRRQLNSKK